MTQQEAVKRADKLAAFRVASIELTAEFEYGGGKHSVTYRPITYGDINDAKRKALARMPSEDIKNISDDESLQAQMADMLTQDAALQAIIAIDGAPVTYNELVGKKEHDGDPDPLAAGFVSQAVQVAMQSVAEGFDAGK